MNHSTENVTLFAAFINDVLRQFEGKQDDYHELFDLAKGLDLSDPFAKVPMQVYNDMCQWVEDNLGKFTLIRIGRNIGETIHGAFIQNKMISQDATPLQIMEALVIAAASMIQDPEGRGWVIAESGPHEIIMRRTQTFNSKLQLGLLDGLVRLSHVSGVKVEYVQEIENGAEFDEYRVSWI